MTATEAMGIESRTGSIARTIVAVICAILVVLSGTLFAGLSLGAQPYEFNVAAVIGGAAALAGFLGLIAVKARWGYYLGVLIITAVPGIIALGLLLLGMLIAWTAGVHTFASSWRPIGGTFALLSPFFLPPVVAGALLLMRECAGWAKGLVVILAISISCAYSVYRGVSG